MSLLTILSNPQKRKLHPLARGLKFALDGNAPLGVFRDLIVPSRSITVLGGLPTRVNAPNYYAHSFDTALNQSLEFADGGNLSGVLNGDWQFVVYARANTLVTSGGLITKGNSGVNQQEVSLFHTSAGGLRLRFNTTATVTDVNWGSAITTDTDYWIRGWRDTVLNRLYLQVNSGTPVFTTLSGKAFTQGNATWEIARAGGRWNGAVGALIGTKIWSDTEWSDAQTGGPNSGPKVYPFFTRAGVKVTSPAPKQVFQRDAVGFAEGHADIPITGTYTGTVTEVWARWNNTYDGFGEWALIDNAPANGRYSGTLENQPAGQGTLEVRAGATGPVVSVLKVGVGEVLDGRGQSNGSGRLDNNQVATHAWLEASLFDNRYQYATLTDPTDGNTGQLDAVTRDPTVLGSWKPLLATMIMAQEGVPVMFLVNEMGGSSITAQKAGGTGHSDPATIYGSGNKRVLLQPGGIRCGTYQQGETDAEAGMLAATYNGHLDTLGDDYFADTGAKLMVSKLQYMSGLPGVTNAEVDAINAAIDEAWNDNPNILPGPDFSDTTVDGYHFESDAEGLLEATRWMAALNANFFQV